MLRRDCPKFKTNPFNANLALESDVSWRSSIVAQNDNMILVNKLTCEVEGTGAIIRKHRVERNQFIKLYAAGAGALLSLNSSGIKVYSIILGKLYGSDSKDKDWIRLTYNSLDDEIQKVVSRSTFTRGVTECVKAGIIAESTDNGTFFINPRYAFNGNRLATIDYYEATNDDKTLERLMD